MRYYKTLRLYKNSSGTNKLDMNQFEAVSYNWWVYLKRINGKLVFNNYSYSPTTCGHQSRMRRLLRSLNIEPDLYIEVPNGLQDLNSAITYYNYKIEKLDQAIDAKGSRNETNVQRLKQIEHYNTKIEEIRALNVG